MKVGIFDPYLDTLGGGERYMMTMAEYFSQQGHQVDVFWMDKKLKKKIERWLNLDLSEVRFCSFEQNVLKRFKIGRNYNLFIHLSDGSIPFLFSQKNILHFQVPFHHVGGQNLLNKIKLRLINKVICNSYFTKKVIDQEYGVNSVVIYPPVDIESFKPLKKENIILSVGRFDSPLHPKKQDILVNGFKRMWKADLSGWKLVLAGGVRDGDKKYTRKLKKMTKGLPVEILVNVDFKTLQQLYGRAKIYWHAAGFAEDEQKHPERMEHFGIVVVEAMASGCVAVVIGKGGIPEIIDDQKNGFLWQAKDELQNLTLQLIKSPKMLKAMSIQAIKGSQKFSKRIFYQKLQELIG